MAKSIIDTVAGLFSPGKAAPDSSDSKSLLRQDVPVEEAPAPAAPAAPEAQAPVQQVAQEAPQQAPQQATPKQTLQDKANTGETISTMRQHNSSRLVAKQRATVGGAALEVMISGMLSGPQTHLYNMVDNTVKAVTAPMETAVKAAISIGRKPEDKTYAREAVYQAGGLIHGFMQSISYAGHRVKSAIPGLPSESKEQVFQRMGISEELGLSSKIGLEERMITGEKILGTDKGFMASMVDALGSVVNVPGTALNEEDMIFKIANYNSAHFGQAARLQAQNPDLSFKDAIAQVYGDAAKTKEAVQYADYMTYTGKPDSYINFILSPTADKIPGLRYIVPFRRAIANIFEHTLERSPLILTSPTLTAKLVSKDPAVADTARSKLLFGMTALTAMSALLTDSMTGPAPYDSELGVTEGQATGIAPNNAVQKDMWDRAYGQPETLRLGGATLSTRELGFYGNFLKLVGVYNQWNANVRVPDALKPDVRNEADRFLKEYGQFVMPIVEIMYDNHWSKNLVEFMAVLDKSVNTDSFGPLVAFLERQGMRAVPVIGSVAMGDIAKYHDPVKKRIKSPGDAFLANVPGLRETLTNQYTWDGWGMIEDKLRYSNGVRNLVDVPYGPQDDLNATMANLGVVLTDISDSINETNDMTGQRTPVFMTPEEWDTFNTYRKTGFGGFYTVRDWIRRTTTESEMWDLYPQPFRRKAMIEKAYAKYVEMARAYLRNTTMTDGIGARMEEVARRHREWQMDQFAKGAN